MLFLPCSLEALYRPMGNFRNANLESLTYVISVNAISVYVISVNTVSVYVISVDIISVCH